MFDAVLGYVVENHVILNQVEENVWCIFFLDLNVRTDTATVAYFTSCCGMEYVGQAVRHTGWRAIGITFGVIESLYATSAGDVIFSGSQFHAAVVRQVAKALHQSLTEGPVANDNSTIHVLQGTGNNFGS